MPLARWLCSAQRTRTTMAGVLLIILHYHPLYGTTMAGVLRGLKGTVKSIARHQP